jgi:hypothetical protein
LSTLLLCFSLRLLFSFNSLDDCFHLFRFHRLPKVSHNRSTGYL